VDIVIASCGYCPLGTQEEILKKLKQPQLGALRTEEGMSACFFRLFFCRWPCLTFSTFPSLLCLWS
jgi:hypothetical protein